MRESSLFLIRALLTRWKFFALSARQVAIVPRLWTYFIIFYSFHIPQLINA